MKKYVPIIFSLILLISLVLPGAALADEPADGPQLAPEPGKGELLGYGGLITLRHDDRYIPFHVPAPPAAQLRRPQATINVTYNPTSCSGSVSPWPANAQAAFDYAVSIWASTVESTPPIAVNACWRSDLDPGVLGSAGAADFYRNFTNAPVSDTWFPIALANAIAGSDLNGTDPEIQANFSSTYDWYYGTDGNPGSKLDFVSVLLHELGHGLGFLGSMDGSGVLGSYGAGTPFPFIYDRFTEDGSGTPLLNYGNPSLALKQALTSGAVYFDGPKADAANGGNRVELYAPAVWKEGSSYSHLDEVFNGTENALMTYSIGNGESEHSPGPVMLGMFEDMGWPLASTTPAPTINSITPSSGENTGPVSITNLSGSDFQTGATVKLARSGLSDIIATSVTVVSTSTITGQFDLSGAATGQWDVVVTNPDDQSDTLTNGFTVNPSATAPTVSSIVPNTAVNTTTVSITNLSGTNFQTGATVELVKSGQTPITATNVTVVNATKITCDFDLNGAAPGLWHVQVTNPNAEQGVLVNGFTVVGETKRVFLPVVMNNYPVFISNGDFEDGQVGWTESSTQGWDLISQSTPVTPHSGTWAVWLGGDDNETSTLQQTVTIPASAPFLTYWYWLYSEDSCGNDTGGVYLDSTQVKSFTFCASGNTSGWTQTSVDLSSYAGQQVALKFQVVTNGAVLSNFFLDDVDFSSSAARAATLAGNGRPDAAR